MCIRVCIRVYVHVCVCAYTCVYVRVFVNGCVSLYVCSEGVGIYIYTDLADSVQLQDNINKVVSQESEDKGGW